MKLTNKVSLLIILITGSFLRLFRLFDIPFTHDEFSALFRTHFSTFSELIEKGVKVDGHPAGVQVFLYYWTELFGTSEWVVKLPFIVLGILSIYLIYLIAKKWYNETVALISSAFLASIQYTIMYSQIARPYGSGLFFSLLMIYFWSDLILKPHKQFNFNLILFILAASLCTYNHYFSLLFAAIVGLSGLFLIKKQYLFKYILSGLAIIVLFLPYFNIFLYQLHIGGVGGPNGWLGKPHASFILKYFEYLFNFSFLSYAVTVLLVFYGIFSIRAEKLHFKYYILFTIWFFLPFLIGYYYSIYVNSVLQFSVLIFSFPFLYFLLFGHIDEQKVWINFVIVLVILSANIYSVVNVRQHYRMFYQSPYKEIFTDFERAKQEHQDVASVIDSHKKISDYYIGKMHIDTTAFVWLDSFSKEKDWVEYLKNKSRTSRYLYFGCMSSNNPLTVSIIENYFPTIVWQKNYAGGTTYLFSTEKPKKNWTITKMNFDEDVNETYWTNIRKSDLVDTISFSGNISFKMDPKSEWSPTYSRPLAQIITNKNNFIDISVKVYFPGNNFKEVYLVSDLSSGKKLIDWKATPFDSFMGNGSSHKWVTIFHSIKLSDVDQNYPNIVLKVYVWNKEYQLFFMDDFTIKLRKGNPVVYGLLRKL